MNTTRTPSSTSMTPEARHALVGPADLWEMKRKFQISFLRGRGLLPQHRLLDLGCGTLRGGIPLIAYLDDGNYTGVEVRADVLAEGQRELVEAGLTGKQPRLLVCDNLDKLDLPDSFDMVWAFAVLIHMSEPIMETALAAVARHLSKEGSFYGNVNVGDDPDGHWQGFPVVCRTWDYYKSSFLRHGLQLEDAGSLEELGHHHPRLTPDRMARQRMLRGWRKQQSPATENGRRGDPTRIGTEGDMN